MFDQGSTSASKRVGRLVKAVTLAFTAMLVLAGIASALVAGNVDGVWGNPTPANTSKTLKIGPIGIHDVDVKLTGAR